MTTERIYKIIFYNQGQIYEIYARQVSQGALYGFVELEGLLFGERSRVVIDPSEERLKKEFEGVTRTYVPLHAVVRIDEVDRQGAARIVPVSKEGTVTPFPLSMPPPGRDVTK